MMSWVNLICSCPSGDWLCLCDIYMHVVCTSNPLYCNIRFSYRLVCHSMSPFAVRSLDTVLPHWLPIFVVCVRARMCVCVKWPVCQKKVKTWLTLLKFECLVCCIIFRNYFFLSTMIFLQFLLALKWNKIKSSLRCSSLTSLMELFIAKWTIKFVAAILVRWHSLFSEKHASLLSHFV